MKHGNVSSRDPQFLIVLLMVQKSDSPVHMVNIPLFIGFLYIPGGAGFVPSTLFYRLGHAETLSLQATVHFYEGNPSNLHYLPLQCFGRIQSTGICLSKMFSLIFVKDFPLKCRTLCSDLSLLGMVD